MPATSGDLLEPELFIESKNRYQYLAFKDMKPAGCEAVDLRSGETYAVGLCSTWSCGTRRSSSSSASCLGQRRITYRLRAEVPGRFHALPVTGCAMYAPAIRCVSDEAVVGIQDAPASTAPTSPRP